MGYRKIFFVILICFILIENVYADNEVWNKRNLHLVPDKQELNAILELDFDNDNVKNVNDFNIDGDGLRNELDPDIDNDGIENDIDPSPYDWREIGYNPFGMLAFLSWNHPWNKYKYSKEELRMTVKALKEAGCSMVRMDFYWNDIEPRKGNFNFDRYDF
ncbi:MAG: beta-galactosidase, partial [Candidatus Omnitrophica bacterium]|nr:beta-galactosidase [Candidatus Omnitrophota bacterium]